LPAAKPTILLGSACPSGVTFGLSNPKRGFWRVNSSREDASAAEAVSLLTMSRSDFSPVAVVSCTAPVTAAAATLSVAAAIASAGIIDLRKSFACIR